MINIGPQQSNDLQTGSEDILVSEGTSKTGSFEGKQGTEVGGWAGSESDKSRARMFDTFKSIGKALGWVIGTLLVLFGVLVAIYTWNQNRLYEDLIIPSIQEREQFKDLQKRVDILENREDSILIQILNKVIELQEIQ
ncbi:MAG: hypothetical protein AB9915_01765 [Candidatus Dojkabacteria bacterium]